MRRTLEKLAAGRLEKEKEFAQKLDELKKKEEGGAASANALRLKHLLSRLEELLRSKDKVSPQEKKRFLAPLSKTSAKELPQKLVNEQVSEILRGQQNLLEENLRLTKESFSSLLDFIQLNAGLADAKDREWDALGSHHAGMIFKSMEWRVDKLAAEYEDVKILMKKFMLLKEKLNQLLAVLEEKKLPSAPEVRAILAPLEDWRYAGFENRFRGYEQEIKEQQAAYLAYFPKGGKILDLGCGRGEFLELLQNHGVDAAGIDINEQMIDICLDKGLKCQRGDLLEKLSEREDGSLSGIFSSQVIEHLPPAYLQRLIELCYRKLAPRGTLVVETVNATSVFALVQIYYLDLSHEKPIHPQALKFLLETAGFENVEIKYASPLKQERLQNLPGADERTAILNQNIDALNDLLFASPNYAAIGRKG